MPSRLLVVPGVFSACSRLSRMPCAFPVSRLFPPSPDSFLRVVPLSLAFPTSRPRSRLVVAFPGVHRLRSLVALALYLNGSLCSHVAISGGGPQSLHLAGSPAPSLFGPWALKPLSLFGFSSCSHSAPRLRGRYNAFQFGSFSVLGAVLPGSLVRLLLCAPSPSGSSWSLHVPLKRSFSFYNGTKICELFLIWKIL